MKSAEPRTVYSWRATIIEWIDGDTVRVQLDRGFEDYSVRSLRVSGIDAPDPKRGDPESKRRRDAARAFARLSLPMGTVVQLESVKGRETEKFGRFLAKITMPDGKDFAAVMIEAGHAVAYNGGKR